MKLLVTGASGFIGSFLIEEGLQRGYEVWAGIRRTSNRKYLQDCQLHFAELDFSSTHKLKEQLQQHKDKHEGWDCIIHCAGATKCKNKSDFDKINFHATQHLVESLQDLDMVPRQFIYISSLSVFGPIHETDYAPIREEDTPCPDTAYGKSKLKSEHYLQHLCDFPYVIFRPTGVYGPREKDYFLLAKSIKNHLDFAVGYKRQEITFIYIKDLVQAVYLAIEKGITHRAYFVSDGDIHTSRDFSDLLKQELGNPFVLHIKSPLWVLKTISLFSELLAHLVGKSSTLNRDKYRIMKQRNWRCDISPLIHELGFNPQYNLKEGVKEIVHWYKEEKWL